MITPYPQVGDENVIHFFSDIGFEVYKVKGLNRPSATAIAETSVKQVVDAIYEVDADDVDCIIQCGTNLLPI